jgi:signal transduction histidine kinase
MTIDTAMPAIQHHHQDAGRHPTLRARLARLFPRWFRNQLLASLLINCAALAAFCLPLWYAWHNQIEDGRTDLILADARRLAADFRARGVDTLAARIHDRVGSSLNDTQQVIQLLAPDGARVAGNLPYVPPGSYQPNTRYTFRIEHHGKTEILSMALEELPGGYRLWVGRDITRYGALERIFILGMAGSALIVFLFSAMMAVGTRRAMLNRVQAINHTTAAIVGGDLSQRLHPAHADEEFDMLTGTLNGMLDQIVNLIQNVRHASNAIAHDLRTPLAELRSSLEHLTIARPPPERTFGAIDDAIADVDRVIAIFNAIMRLAEIDSGTRRAGFKGFDLGRLIGDAVEFYAPVADEAGIGLGHEVEDGMKVHGDPLLLAQAIGNLIDNALKYAGSGSTIRIGASRDAGQVAITVADNGPGIAQPYRDKAAERFFRLDQCRASPGVGLGLALVQAVAHLHGGALRLEDNAPGLRAVIMLRTEIPSHHPTPPEAS